MRLHNQRGATPNKPSHTEIHTLSPKKGFGATTDQKPGPDPQQACNQATKLADAKPIPAKENMSNYETLKSRLEEHVGTIREADGAIFDPEAPVTGTLEALPQAFNDNIDKRQEQDLKLRCSLFRGGDPDGRVYGFAPHASVTRKVGDALKIRIAGSTNGAFTLLTTEELEATYSDWISGVLTLSTAAQGARAATLHIGSTAATVHLGGGTANELITHLEIDVGGSGGPKESMPIEEAVVQLGLRWEPVAGRPAAPAARARFAAFDGTDLDAVGRIIIPKELLTGNDRLLGTIMEELIIIPRADEGSPVSDLAGFIVCAWDLAEHYEATLLCVAECVKMTGSALDGQGPGIEAAATVGASIITSFAALLNGLGGAFVSKMATEFVDARALDSPRRRGAIFGAGVRLLATTPPAPDEMPSPEAKRIAMLRRQAELVGHRGPRAVGPSGMFGPPPPVVTTGANAGAFAILVPLCEPAATRLDVITHMGGEAIVGEMRAWAAIRADTGATFNLLSPQSIAYAEEDFAALEMRALGPVDQRVPKPRPEDWDDSMGFFQRIITTALTNEARGQAIPGRDGLPTPIPGAKFRPPRGSVVELTKATDSSGGKLMGAIAAGVALPLGRPEVILATHAMALELERQAPEARPDAYTLARRLVDDKDLGKSYRGLFACNLFYSGELPEKGEIAMFGVAIKAELSADLRLDVEKGLGNVLAEAEHKRVTTLVTQVTTFRTELELVTQLLGACPSLDDEVGTSGRLGQTSGPTAAADIERAMLRLAELWTRYGGRVLGVDLSTPHFAAPTLVQQCRELSDTGRINVIQHALDTVSREVAAMRREIAAPLVDITGAFIQARVGKLMKTRTLEEARLAGLEAAREESARERPRSADKPKRDGSPLTGAPSQPSALATAHRTLTSERTSQPKPAHSSLGTRGATRVRIASQLLSPPPATRSGELRQEAQAAWQPWRRGG